MFRKIILPLWIVAGISLFLYSFTQMDLSLTFSQASFFQIVQKGFQYVGWFNRPLSAVLYLIIICILFGLYFLTLKMIREKKIDGKTVWKIVISLSAILFLSYNAFSYDLFNYIFDAKILVHYQQNPYFHKALDFSGDPMLSFMHWTHRTYPYGPGWLAITAPISFLGMNIFSITFYLFKLVTVAVFIWACILIKKIAQKTNVDPALSVAAFALNPLVLVEVLVSAHNDIFMMAFGLFAVYLFLEKKYVGSFLGLAMSIAIKYATVLLIPAVLIKRFTKISNQQFFLILTATMIAATLFATFRTNFQPWYLLYFLPFAAFLQEKYYISIPIFILSFAGLLEYLPYLYIGNYNPPVPIILNQIMVGSIIISLVLVLVRKFKYNK